MVELVALVAAAAGCGDGPTGGGKAGSPGIRAVAGAGVTDTVDAQPTQALVVEVRGPTGAPARGAVVRFEPGPAAASATNVFGTPSSAHVCRLTASTCPEYGGFGGTTVLADTTRADGRVSVLVRLGPVAGPAVIRVHGPGVRVRRLVTYTCARAPRRRGHDGRAIASPSRHASAQGGVRDRRGNARTDAVTYG
jgi:hypothetical protein